MKKTYAGIGARRTPENVIAAMKTIAKVNHAAGYFLHSGGASGADEAFASSTPTEDQRIFHPGRKGISETQWSHALQLASMLHPCWQACKPYVRRLHARNAFIVLGEDLDAPVEFVVCWTANASITGGTGMTLRIAKEKTIPIINLGMFTSEELPVLMHRYTALMSGSFDPTSELLSPPFSS